MREAHITGNNPLSALEAPFELDTNQKITKDETMTTANIIHKTPHLFILGMALGACQGIAPNDPGPSLYDETASGTGHDGEGSDDDADDDDDNDDDHDDHDDDAAGDESGGSDGTSTTVGDSVGDDVAMCGNGVVQAGEDCDDDNDDDLDGCMSDCRFGPIRVQIDTSNPTTLPQMGNLGGGGPHESACANGEVIIGIEGRAGALIDRVQVQCGIAQLFDPEEPEVLDLTIVPSTVLPPYGGSGGSPFKRSCPAGHAVVGFGGRTGSYIDVLTLSCARMFVVDDGQSMAIGFDEPFDLEPVGGGGGGPVEPRYCGEGEVATSASLRTGALVDAFGLTCMPISLAY